MVKLPSFLRFGAKSAKRHTIDYSTRGLKKANPDESTTVKLRDYIATDAELASAMRKFVDNVLQQMPYVMKKENSKLADSTIESYNENLRDVRFYRKLRNGVYSLLFNGNAFFEIKFKGKKLTELYNIDPDTIKIVTNTSGEPVKYIQQIENAPEVEFMPEEIVHITIDHLQASEWGMAFLKPLKNALHRKSVAESYLEWVIANNKMAPLIKSKTKSSMQTDELSRIRAEIEAISSDPNRYVFLNFDVEEDLEIMSLFTTDNFNDITAYIEKQKEAILTVLQVPPIIAGNVDNSNRSNSEIQARYVFYNTIVSFQNLLIEELNFELLRKLNWKDTTFKFAEVDKRSETDVIKIAKSLKQDLMFTNEAVLEYLKENGFKIPKVEKIFEEVVVEENPTPNSSDYPSREARDKTGLPQNEALRQEDKQMGVSSNAN